jgi:hypothetical protein
MRAGGEDVGVGLVEVGFAGRGGEVGCVAVGVVSGGSAIWRVGGRCGVCV